MSMNDYFDEEDFDEDYRDTLHDEFYQYALEDDPCNSDEYEDYYLEQWNPVKCPHAWYTCRACNGMGEYPDNSPCEVCNRTGIKYAWVVPFFRAVNYVKNKLYSLPRFPVHRCSCGRWYFDLSGYFLCKDETCPNSSPF